MTKQEKLLKLYQDTSISEEEKRSIAVKLLDMHILDSKSTDFYQRQLEISEKNYMGKQIPIDDLFRDGLYNAEEQLNLGAWANMERMLDGKNPYAEEEINRLTASRRILSIALVIISILDLIALFFKH